MKIELILLGIIGAVFAIDFILKGIKKPTSDKIAIIVDETTKDSIQKDNKNISKYISKRKKNISLVLIIISFLKIILHYTLYPQEKKEYVQAFIGKPVDYVTMDGMEFSHMGTHDFGKHIEFVFEYELFLFIPSITIVLFIAWFFNDKIKAR